MLNSLQHSALSIQHWRSAAAAGRKPNSVLRPCGRSDNHSSSPVITDGIKRPTRRLRTGSPGNASLFGLAPCGVLPATRVTTSAVRSYRTFSPLPTFAPSVLRWAVYFLCHYPSGHPDRALPGALPYGVRTFLPPPPSGLRWASPRSLLDRSGLSTVAPKARRWTIVWPAAAAVLAVSFLADLVLLELLV
jgi:hypothetical protein